MSNKELYKETFSKLHASDGLDLEVMRMKEKRKGFRCRRSFMTAVAIMTVMLAMSAIAYAATGGKIVERVKVWIGGEAMNFSGGDLVRSEDGQFIIKIDKSEGDHTEATIYKADKAAEN